MEFWENVLAIMQDVLATVIAGLVLLLLDALVLKGKARITAARSVRKYFTIGKSKIGKGGWVIKGDE